MGVKGSIFLPIHNKKVNQHVCTNNFLSISFSLLNQSIYFFAMKKLTVQIQTDIRTYHYRALFSMISVEF